MKNLKLYLFGFLSTLLAMSCSTVDVKQGTMGVLIKRPYFFGSSGVEVLPPDLYYIALSSSVEMVEVKPIKVTEEFDDLTTKDNVPVDFTINFTLKLINNK